MVPSSIINPKSDNSQVWGCSLRCDLFLSNPIRISWICLHPALCVLRTNELEKEFVLIFMILISCPSSEEMPGGAWQGAHTPKGSTGGSRDGKVQQWEGKWAHLWMGNIPSPQSNHHELWRHQWHFPKVYFTPFLHGWVPTPPHNVEATLRELSELVLWEVLPWECPSQMTPSDHS